MMLMKRFLLPLLGWLVLPVWADTPAASEAAASAPAASAPIAYVCHTADGRTIQTAVPEGRCRPISAADRQQLEAAAATPATSEPAAPKAASEPATASKRAQAYICQTPDGKAVFTSEPMGRCQPSQMGGASISTPPVAVADGELARMWAEAEAAAASDVQILPPMRVILRQHEESQAPRTTLSSNIRHTPAPVYTPPRQLTRKELVERDIRREEIALAREESQLAAARLGGNAARIRNLTQIVNDRRNGLNALRQEMRRFP